MTNLTDLDAIKARTLAARDHLEPDGDVDPYHRLVPALEQATVPLGALALVAHDHAVAHPDGGAGLCLPVAAALGWALREHHDTLATAVVGTFDGHAHWWLEVDGVRIDPTRHQFDDRHDLTYPIADADGYVSEATYPALWTREQVIAEAERAFACPAAAHVWVTPLLGGLGRHADASA